MNEAQTRLNKIDPKLRDAGWSIVPGSKILVEQSAYIAPGRITTTGHKNPKKADYILEYKGIKLAVIEAKSDEKDVLEAVAKQRNRILLTMATGTGKTFINIKFNSMSDAKERLQMSVADIRAHYFELQRRLYYA